MGHYGVITDEEFFRRLPKGHESDWLHVADLTVASGRLSVLDPMYSRDVRFRHTFDLPPKVYTVSLKLIRYPEDQRVSRFRVGALSATLASQIGAVGVDSGQVAVYDPVA